jgi:omega-6 fatty acid desaturase (delta-12 desaturase)
MPGDHKRERPEWFYRIKPYAQPDWRRAVGQIFNSLVPYLALLAAMLYLVSHGYPYWITLALSVPATGFFIRTFIIFHDCCHESFLPSERVNNILGYCIGVLAFTPYEQWRWTHFVHHETFGNLDHRGVGDIKLMTVDEYRAAPWLTRAMYRIYRNPFVMFGIGSAVLFALIYRFPIKSAPPEARFSVWFTDIALIGIVGGLSLLVGFPAYLMAQGPTLFLAWMLGVWIFYVQHQFTGVYWARDDRWNFADAVLHGASYYRLPRVLQWFTGNIGLHHVHHARSMIPNYHLQQCYDATPELQSVTPQTLRTSMSALRNNLYDEEQGRLVPFSDLHATTPLGPKA